MNRKHSVTRVAFIYIAIIAIIWALFGFISPPSNHAYNPHTSYTSHNEKGILKTFEELNKIESENDAAKASSSLDIEAWTASRSDLAAQWETADMAHLAFRMGLLGIILLSWTLFETRNAADSAAKTLSVAQDTLNVTRNGTKAEFQPYIVFPREIRSTLVSKSDGQGGHGIHCFVEAKNIRNRGKTAAEHMTINAKALITNGSLDQTNGSLDQNNGSLDQTNGNFDQYELTAEPYKLIGDFLVDTPQNANFQLESGELPYDIVKNYNSNKVIIHIQVSFKDMFTQKRTYLAIYAKSLFVNNADLKSVAEIKQRLEPSSEIRDSSTL